MNQISLVARSVCHLKPKQIAYQLMRRYWDWAEVPPVNDSVLLRHGVTLIEPLSRLMSEQEYSFIFLNVKQDFEPSEFDWAPTEVDKLWRYNLHYFDYLNEVGRSWESKRFLIDSWIEDNPQGTVDAWEPFPVSLRIVNWVKLFLSPQAGGNLEKTWLESLYEQVLWLEKNIEYHLLANHYFKNGVALFFGGMFFAGTDADRWIKKGMQIILSEVKEQILHDGGHFERSPMYHAMILEDCLDILNMVQGSNVRGTACLNGTLRGKCRGMVKFMLGMTHPDGEIALFNDAAFGIEKAPVYLAKYFERLTGESVPAPSDKCWSFPDTGYYVMCPSPGERLIIDNGPVGPDYQPGHSHCDNLSFEFSLKGRRIIVDSGCCQYFDGDMRRYNRGNSGHNTVTIDGENQSEVWGAHRCGRRAYPIASKHYEDGHSIIFKGAHDGYTRLKGRPVHARRVVWREQRIAITDSVYGSGNHDIISHLHVHPDLEVIQNDGSVAIKDGKELVMTVFSQGSHKITITEGWYCPQFGLRLRCPVLCQAYKDVDLPFEGGWRFDMVTGR